MNSSIINQSEAQRIAQGFFDYSKSNFKHFDKLGYFEVQINTFDKDTDITLCFGAGWCNTPWHNDLMDFYNDLLDRVQKKYSFISSKSLCGYASCKTVAKVGGMLDEYKLRTQMRYPEQY